MDAPSLTVRAPSVATPPPMAAPLPSARAVLPWTELADSTAVPPGPIFSPPPSEYPVTETAVFFELDAPSRAVRVPKVSTPPP